MTFRLLFSVLLVITGSDLFSQRNVIIEKGNKIYLANTIILKMKDNLRKSGTIEFELTPALSTLLQEEIVISSQYLLNYPQERLNNTLREIIQITYSSNTDPEFLSRKINNLKEVEWAEPYFLRKPDFVPNDTNYTLQYALPRIEAEQAWDITKGDSSIIIAIVDTGVDWDHPDLEANIWINRGEIPGNGIDDDGNGFVDDIRGWDFGGLNGTPDNDPKEDRPDHGTHVAGVASAVTDNHIGVASIGFNSTIMAVKTSRDDVRSASGQALIYYGWAGILYAADNGARIINLSWGGEGYSQFEQAVVDYAVSQGALLVGAAGNSGVETDLYPASYHGVISVTSTGSNDVRSSFSSFGIHVDVSAPGAGIYSTWQNDTYRYLNGTSFSAPMTSGLAALVAHQFPLYNPLQIGEQVRVNSDDINALNPNFRYLIGRGRINAFKAVSNTTSRSVRATEVIVNDDPPNGDGDGIFEPGEIITIGLELINYLNTTSNLVITLESYNDHSTVLNGTFNAGQRGTLETFNNFGNLFTVQIHPVNIPENEELIFIIRFTDGAYTDFQPFKVLVNPSYANQFNGELLLTITSDGTLGFLDFPDNNRGSGFIYQESENLLFEGALIIGTSASRISDAARITTDRSYDFLPVQPFIISEPGIAADQQGNTVFTDVYVGPNRVGVTVNLRSYTYSNDEDNDYIILRYTLQNTTAAAISNLYAGLFFDWDFADANSDITSFDVPGNFGYVYRNGGNPDTWVGVASVSALPTGFHAIRNNGTQGNINLFDANGFSDAEKWLSISSGTTVLNTGPGDVSHVVNSGPYNIDPSQSVDVAFAIVAGYNLEELRERVTRARLKFQSILLDADEEEFFPVSFALYQNYPNPFNPSTRIEFTLPERNDVVVRVFTILGEEAAVLLNQNLTAGRYSLDFDPSDYNLAGGVYIYSIKAGNNYQVRKMVYLK
jgi:serine protease